MKRNSQMRINTLASDHDGRRLRFEPVTLLGGKYRFPTLENVIEVCL